MNPVASISLRLVGFKSLEASIKAKPPPTTYPSSKAALTANSASSILSLFSFASTSESPPDLIIQRPPFNFPILS